MAATRRATSLINSPSAASAVSSPLNNSLNNILNYSPPQYVNKTVSKSSTPSASNQHHHNNNISNNNSNGSSSNNNLSNNTTAVMNNNNNNNNVHSSSLSSPPPSSSKLNTNSSPPTNGHPIHRSSLLCYQNVPAPSPIPLLLNGKSSSQNSIPTISLEDPLVLQPPVKKRNKLRHRFSDVGSWGRRKEKQKQKYRSMNIETLEVLGDPVIEDEFFVSKNYFRYLFPFTPILLFICIQFVFLCE